MPIKLPKLQKRKSSGNVLEEIHNPPESTFKVFERPSDRAKSFDGGITLKLASQGAPRPPPKEKRIEEEEELFPRPLETLNRNGTETSLNTAPNDSGASSLRLSSSSTNPSSVESRSEKTPNTHVQRPFNDIPVPPPHSSRSGFLRNTARTFSLGVGKNVHKEPEVVSTPPLPPLPIPKRPDGVGDSRGRQVTSSSTSTATPPRLFDSDLVLENSELDGFGKMFDDFNLKSSRATSPNRMGASRVCPPTEALEDLSADQKQDLPSSPSVHYPPTSYRDSHNVQQTAPSAPFFGARNDNIQSSPYSFVSQDSQDVLIRSPSPPKSSARTVATKFGGQSIRSTDSASDLRRTGTGNTTTSTMTKIRSHSPGRNTQYKYGGTSPIFESEAFVNDPSFVASANLAARYQDARPPVPKLPSKNKIMTPAQFEKYKQQREMDRRLGIKSDESDESDGGDDYEEEDETERDKKAVKQRKKQEANLAVYRQTMMKVTGEHVPAKPSSGMSDLGRQSPADSNRRTSRMTLDPRQQDTTPTPDEEDEDEDVPLGILAAHGFPNKNRPPTRIAGARSFSPAPGIGPSQSTPSLVGESQNRTSLPVFARNLPQDPYYGAGLVNPSNRESLAFNGGNGPYMASGASTAHPLHPAGLVGVIDGEERARAWRRGSPNTQGGYDLPPGVQHPGMMRSQTTPNLNYGMQPGMEQMLTPGDQAQIHMSQQMTQMMQVQMQWMNQMQQLMAGQGGMPPGMMPPGMMPPGMGPHLMVPPGMSPNNFLAPPSMHRPQSTYQGAPSVAGGRAMSMINPQLPMWNSPGMDAGMGMGGYAASIAPSERSNVGLASRYRPVSVAPDMEPDMKSTRRTSTFTSSTLRPFSQMDLGSNQSIANGPSQSAPAGNLFSRKPLPVRIVDEEEDDDLGWAEMKAKKESKQRKWRLRKGQKTADELYR